MLVSPGDGILHRLQCEICYDGIARISENFLITPLETLNTHQFEASFRGRRLEAANIPLPSIVKGMVMNHDYEHQGDFSSVCDWHMDHGKDLMLMNVSKGRKELMANLACLAEAYMVLNDKCVKHA